VVVIHAYPYGVGSFLNKIPLTFGGKGWPHLYHKMADKSNAS
jgi:hypothetical protein